MPSACTLILMTLHRPYHRAILEAGTVNLTVAVQVTDCSRSEFGSKSEWGRHGAAHGRSARGADCRATRAGRGGAVLVADLCVHLCG